MHGLTGGRRPDGPTGLLAIPDAAIGSLSAAPAPWTRRFRPTVHGSLYAGRRVRPSGDGGPIPPARRGGAHSGHAPHRRGRTPTIPPASATGLRRLRHDR